MNKYILYIFLGTDLFLLNRIRTCESEYSIPLRLFEMLVVKAAILDFEHQTLCNPAKNLFFFFFYHCCQLKMSELFFLQLRQVLNSFS